MESKEKAEKLLVLCVDRDGDIVAKTEEGTPILGRKGNLDAAVSLAQSPRRELSLSRATRRSDPKRPSCRAYWGRRANMHAGDERRRPGRAQRRRLLRLARPPTCECNSARACCKDGGIWIWDMGSTLVDMGSILS